ncbi:hypothetical protein GQ53DRAFT_640768 [Thozetella sp. PMI_491]|nr:hypothetical protein GQ53DRAFT_640768 [Thozetella sp. PMI_491]
MRKWLGKPTVDSSHDTSLGVTSSPNVPQSYRTSASQNVVYHVGAPIAAIDRSPDGHAAVLAGRRVLRTVSFDGLSIREGIDIRAMITAQHSTKVTGIASVADQLSIKDVTWGTVQGNGSIFTGCASGKIFHYDLTTLSANVAGGSTLEVIQMREDSRQINALDINPHRGTLLLSGSQDGLVRCFDIRVPVHTRTGYSFRSVQAFKCNAEGVRQVQWSPKDGFLFACGADQGAVLKWDIRKPSAPMLKLKAHEKSCTAIAWHQDGDHLMSGGFDNKCYVWDFSKTADKRQKPKYSISTCAPVASIAWRPGQWSATAQGRRAAQVAVSYEDNNQRRNGVDAVHIWDLARPTMPFKEVRQFENSPSALLWHDQDLLWTAGQDGLFNQCDVAFAPKVLDRQAVSTLAFSSQGDVLMFLDERPPSDRPRRHLTRAETLPIPSYSSSPTQPLLSVSRSDSEDDVASSFLARRKSGRRRRPSTRSMGNLSTTPPTGPGSADDRVFSLEQSVKITGSYRTQQAMAIGHVPAAAKAELYEYLSFNYLDALSRFLPPSPDSGPLVKRVEAILEHYARAAENASLFRLAQTWRILGYAMGLLLRRRAQYHFEQRMENLKSGIKKKVDPLFEAPRLHFDLPLESKTGQRTPQRAVSAASPDKHSLSRSLLAEEFESTSNVPTPLARPVRDDSEIPDIEDVLHGSYVPPKKLTPIIEPDSFTSGMVATHILSLDKRHRLDSEPLSVHSEESAATEASTDGYDFYDTDALSLAIDVPARKQTAPLPSGYRAPSSPNHSRQPVARQDSDESFGQLFSISDGSRGTTGLTGSFESTSKATNVPATPGKIRHSGSDLGDGEFQSRIRGKQLDESPEQRVRLPFRQLQRTETNLTTYTDEHHMITQTSDSFDSPGREFPSQTTDPETNFGSPVRVRPVAVGRANLSEEKSEFIIETDYLHWFYDPPYPYPVKSSDFSPSTSLPLQPYTIISRALSFEVKSSALNASAMILLLKPLLPDDIIDPLQAAAILRQHHSRLMKMKLFVEAASLRKLCMKGWPGDVLSDWGEDYPTIFDPAQQGVKANFLCSTCRKPRDIDRTSNSKESIWRCESCQSSMAPCAVCGHRDTTPNLPLAPIPTNIANTTARTNPLDEPIIGTWWFCPGCGHGGHSTCLQGWHSVDPNETSQDYASVEFSGGCCPLDGCGHACLPGRAHSDAVMSRTEEVVRAVREATSADPSQLRGTQASRRGFAHASEHRVHGDRHDVPQSRAVESVRETLGVGLESQGTSSTRPMSNSASPGGRNGEIKEKERERRKSVKFLTTEDKK